MVPLFTHSQKHYSRKNRTPTLNVMFYNRYLGKGIFVIFSLFVEGLSVIFNKQTYA
jgi:hypothetical protein